jgi:hypothetical protein
MDHFSRPQPSSQPTSRQLESPRFRRRTLATAAASIAAGAAVGTEGHAAIVYSGEVNQLVSMVQSADLMSWLGTSTTITSKFGGQLNPGVAGFSGGTLLSQNCEYYGATTETPRLTAGVQLSSADTWSSWSTSPPSTLYYGSPTGPTPAWLAGDRGYFGWRVPVNSDYQYGWSDISIAADGLSATVHSWAFQDTLNAPITTGAVVPEPALAGLAVMATGLALVAQRMRRTWLRRADA